MRRITSYHSQAQLFSQDDLLYTHPRFLVDIKSQEERTLIS